MTFTPISTQNTYCDDSWVAWLKHLKTGKTKEQVVLEMAKKISQRNTVRKVFCAMDIQRKLFPRIKRFSNQRLGISGAIQRLKKKGLIIDAPNRSAGWYLIPNEKGE